MMEPFPKIGIALLPSFLGWRERRGYLNESHLNTFCTALPLP